MSEKNGGMTYLRAIAICADHLDDPEIDDVEKGLAIHRIMTMETINAVNKDTLRKIIRYLWPFVYEWEEENAEGENVSGNESKDQGPATAE